eukprot:GHVQ01038810.1.p1 GENE.GHVQ01038810.1~~GHVQ01038810.1.p1  ORF type:complete len:929 (-),score=132.28 GHVQ01038810.1:712-3498(-)
MPGCPRWTTCGLVTSPSGCCSPNRLVLLPWQCGTRRSKRQHKQRNYKRKRRSERSRLVVQTQKPRILLYGPHDEAITALNFVPCMQQNEESVCPNHSNDKGGFQQDNETSSNIQKERVSQINDWTDMSKTKVLEEHCERRQGVVRSCDIPGVCDTNDTNYLLQRPTETEDCQDGSKAQSAVCLVSGSSEGRLSVYTLPLSGCGKDQWQRSNRLPQQPCQESCCGVVPRAHNGIITRIVPITMRVRDEPEQCCSTRAWDRGAWASCGAGMFATSGSDGLIKLWKISPHEESDSDHETDDDTDLSEDDAQSEQEIESAGDRDNYSDPKVNCHECFIWRCSSTRMTNRTTQRHVHHSVNSATLYDGESHKRSLHHNQRHSSRSTKRKTHVNCAATLKGHTLSVTALDCWNYHPLLHTGLHNTSCEQTVSQLQLTAGAASPVFSNYSGGHLLSGSRDCTVCLWDLHTQTALSRVKIQRNVVTCCKVYNPICPKTSSVPASVETLNISSVESTAHIPNEVLRHGSTTGYGEDARRGVSSFAVQGGEDLSVRVWSLQSAGLSVVQTLSVAPNQPSACDVTQDGKYIIVGTKGFDQQSCLLHVFDIRKSSKPIHSVVPGFTHTISALLSIPPPHRPLMPRHTLSAVPAERSLRQRASSDECITVTCPVRSEISCCSSTDDSLLKGQDQSLASSSEAGGPSPVTLSSQLAIASSMDGSVVVFDVDRGLVVHKGQSPGSPAVGSEGRHCHNVGRPVTALAVHSVAPCVSDAGADECRKIAAGFTEVSSAGAAKQSSSVTSLDRRSIKEGRNARRFEKLRRSSYDETCRVLPNTALVRQAAKLTVSSTPRAVCGEDKGLYVPGRELLIAGAALNLGCCGKQGSDDVTECPDGEVCDSTAEMEDQGDFEVDVWVTAWNPSLEGHRIPCDRLIAYSKTCL